MLQRSFAKSNKVLHSALHSAPHSFFFCEYWFAHFPRFPSVISPRVSEDGCVDLINTLNTAGKLVIYE